jgi:preprotein translocase subunit SecF
MSDMHGSSPAQRSLRHRLYHGETAIDFVGRKNRWFAISGIVILVGLVSLFTRGLNFGIDFRGGTSWEVKSATVSAARVKDTLAPLGLADAKIEVLNGTGGRILRVQGDVKGTSAKATDTKTKVRDDLAQLAGVPREQVAFDDVGPSWGNEISKKAYRALFLFFVAITAYISLRFEWKMAVAAITAVVHDILVTVGIYSLSGFQVTPGTVIAFLTILGYSLYDTIVVFDKVQENTRGLASSGRMTYADTVNLSMNQVLMRSINTSFVAILPVLSVLILGAYVFGATSLEDFGLALSIGLLTGAYSSIFIASPLLAILKEREPRYASIRQRIAARGAATAPLTPAAAAAGALTGRSAGGDIDGPPLKPRGAASRAAAGAPAGAGAAAAPAAGGDGAARGGARPANRPANRPSANRPPPRPRKKGRRR